MTFHVVIPARYGSTRLPGKPLLDIGGRPMIQWVVDAACRSGAEEVIVATDDARIAAVVADPRGRGSPAMLTRADHPSGTDRIAEVAALRGWSEATIVVNVQGDEPQLPCQLIDQVASLLARDPRADLATLCTPIVDELEFRNPNVVKVVTAGDGAALYFSRASIPYVRDTETAAYRSAFRHLGIYAYRVAALQRLTALPVSRLEALEKLEQLRALEAGMRIAVGVASVRPGVGIDTPEDIERLRAAHTDRR